MNWWRGLKGRLRFKEPLSRHTSFKIGGSASMFFEPKDIADLTECLKNLRKFKLPYFLIGNGTNLLIRDKDFKGMVIKLSSPFFKNITIRGKLVTVGAGVNLQNLINHLSKIGLGGYEFLAGIPGSIAGALVMNAGTANENKRKQISDIINGVKVIDKNGKALNLSRKDCGFGYRRSKLDKYIILQAQLRLKKDKKITSNNRVQVFLSRRNSTQDYSKPNAGCIFKNPSLNVSAGKLIEECGLKGLRFGGAMVSCKHANFILNFNRATADDVIKLIDIIKKNVRDRFGITLKEEIKIVS